METISTDLCIIGGGSGGLSLAAGAVQMGARVILIEGGKMGGDCLNYGCVPSKALLAAGKAAQSLRKGAVGIAGVEPEIDFAAVKAQVATVIAGIAPVDSQERFEGLGVTVLRGYASFINPREVEVAGKVIRARRFVIATGSQPMIPSTPGLADVPYLTNETIFAQTERPAHLLILGGGPIALEMAQAHRRLGCEVTVIARSRVMGRDDAEAVAVVAAALRAEGVAKWRAWLFCRPFRRSPTRRFSMSRTTFRGSSTRTSTRPLLPSGSARLVRSSPSTSPTGAPASRFSRLWRASMQTW